MASPSEAETALVTRLTQSARIDGKILDVEGVGAASVLVFANGMARGNLGWGLTRTAGDGSFSLRVPANQVYTISCLNLAGAAAPLTGVIAREGAPRLGLEMRMNKGVVVRGRVTYAGDHRPAARQQVRIELPAEEVPEEFRLAPRATQRWPARLQTITDDDGHYAFRLVAGDYRIEVGNDSSRITVPATSSEKIVSDFEIALDVRKPAVAPTLIGVVVERTGLRRPVAGAEVREVTTEQTGFPPLKAIADANGRFVFLGGVRPRLLYARSPDGTLAGYVEVAPTGEIEVPLGAAATVLGRLVDRTGNPVRARRVQIWMTGGAGAHDLTMLPWEVYSDETGAFLFSGFVPGSAGSVSAASGAGKREHAREDVREFKVPGPEPIVLEIIVVLPEASRPVIGRVILPANNPLPVDWTHGSGTIESSSAAIRPPEGLSAHERFKWYQVWSESEVGKAYTRTRHSYAVKLAPDGSFHVPDVRPGSYALSIQVTEPRNTNQIGLENRVLATAQLSFLVPEVLPDRKNDPFDVGSLEVKIAQRLRVGDLAPPLQLETLDGKTMLKLEDYRGKYVLLQFWATWCVPCHAQTVFLKQVEEAFGKDKRFALVGVNWDHKTSDAIAFVGKHQIPWVQGSLGDTQSPRSPGARIIKDYSVGLPQIWLIGPDGRIVARDLQNESIERAVANALGKGK